MKQMRKKDWSHELTLAFAAPAPKRKEAFLKTMPVPQIRSVGIFLYTASICPETYLDFFHFHPARMYRDCPIRFRWRMLENRCIAAVSDFDHNYRICQIHAMEYGRTGNEL